MAGGAAASCGTTALLVLSCAWWGPLPALVGWCSEVEVTCRLNPAMAVAVVPEVSEWTEVTGGSAAAGAAAEKAQEGG